MGHSKRLNAFWMWTALAIELGCSADINPQPEPPGFSGPSGNGSFGGATTVVGAAGGGFNISLGGAMNTGGAQSSGTGNAASLSTGGSLSDSANDDGGLREDASSASGSDASVDALDCGQP